MLKKTVVQAGISGTLLVALIGVLPQMWQSWLAHRREMAAIEQSAEQQRHREMCAEAGGKWWRGDCLEPVE